MISKEHYLLAFELKKKAQELKNLDTTQLGFDLATLKESDELFFSCCKNGTESFENYWIDELRGCYEPIVMLQGRSEWVSQGKKDMELFSYECLFSIDLYKITREEELITPVCFKITFSLIHENVTTFKRIYRLKIVSEMVDGKFNTLDIENSSSIIFSKEYLAHQINVFAADWEDLSKGSFLISGINCIK